MIPAVQFTPDFGRIVALPRREWQDDGHAQALTDVLRQGLGGMTLRDVQAQALTEAYHVGGLFAPIGVGRGKTLISLLFFLVVGSRRPLLLIPAKLREKTRRDQIALANHWRIPNFIRIESFELLGRAQSANLLELYQPDAIFADEAHKLRNTHAACTKRVGRWMNDHPLTKFGAASGTITKRSLRDYWHIMKWCLKMGTPLPQSWSEIELWANALDQHVDERLRALPGALSLFAENLQYHQAFVEIDKVRQGFRRRFTETPGVVVSLGETVNASIIIQGTELPTSPAQDDAFKHLRTKWEMPDGWALTDAMSVWRVARELSLGFYYRWFCFEKWNRWQKTLSALGYTLRNNWHKGVLQTNSIALAIENACENSIEIEKAATLLNKGKNFNLGIDTALIWTNTNNSWQFVGNLAKFAEAQNEVGAVLPSTIATKPEGSVGFFAHHAIARSPVSEMMLWDYSVLCSICSEICRPPESWLLARREWAHACRAIISDNRRHLDSELMVRRAIEHYPWARPILKAWQDIEPSFTPNTVPVWLDDQALDVCARWAAESTGIVWCEHVAFAKKLAERTGLSYYGRDGLDQRTRFIDDADPQRSFIASVASNAEGRNLQAWCRNLITSVPANGVQWEQLIGRTHREGQEADDVTFDVLYGCAEHVRALWRAKADAQYILDTTGAEQKLLIADITYPDEPPQTGLRYT